MFRLIAEHERNGEEEDLANKASWSAWVKKTVMSATRHMPREASYP